MRKIIFILLLNLVAFNIQTIAQTSVINNGSTIDVYQSGSLLKSMDKDGLSLRNYGASDDQIRFIQTNKIIWKIYFDEVVAPSEANVSDLIATISGYISNNTAISSDTIRSVTTSTIVVDSTLQADNGIIINNENLTFGTANKSILFGGSPDNKISELGTNLALYSSTGYRIYIGGSISLWLNTSALYPNLTMTVDLGRFDKYYRVAYVDSLQISGNANIAGTLKSGNDSIADNDATPSVISGNIFTYAGSANSVTITDLDTPTAGVIYTLIGNSDTYTMTINDGGNFRLSGGVNFVMGDGDMLVLYCVADNDYIEISRSDN